MKLPFKFSLPLKSLVSRFPIAVVLIAALAVSVYYSTAILEYTDADNYRRFLLGLVSAGLIAGVFATVAIQYASERFATSAVIKYIAQFVTLALIASLVFMFMAPDLREFSALDGMLSSGSIRLITLVAISGLSLFSLPFIATKDSTQWWNFTHTNIFRLAVSYLYGLTIFLGLALALFAIESFWDYKLLGEDQYALIAVFSYILFAPYYFLADFHKYDIAQEVEKLNKYLSFFLKFILTPLIFVYLIILYPYILQFPFRDEWPSNELTTITTVLMGMNALSFILLYGQEEVSFTLFKKYTLTLHSLYYKFITLLSLPTLFFLIYSLYLRINAYDWTVNRFGLLALIIWAIGVLLYYNLSETRKAAYVVTALIIVIFSVYMLPFTYMISKAAQENRLVELMEQRLPKNENVFGLAENLTYDNISEMKDILEYLNTYHNLSGIRPLLSDKIISAKSYTESDRIESYGWYQVEFAKKIEGSWEDPDTINNEYYSLIYATPGLDISSLETDLNTVTWSSSYKTQYFDSSNISFEFNDETFEFTLPQENYDLNREICPENIEGARSMEKYYYNEYPYTIESYALCGIDQTVFTAKSVSGSIFVIKTLDGYFNEESFTMTQITGYYIK